MLRILLAPLVTICLLCSSAFCEEPNTEPSKWGQWQEARSFYDAGKFDEALKSLTTQPLAEAGYYYNLGLINYRLGKLGAAVAYFEKASRMSAYDADIQHNLKTARTALERTIGPNRLDPASSWAEALADNVRKEEAKGVLSLFSLIVLLFWIRAFLRNRSLRMTLLHPGGILGGLAILLAGSAYLMHRVAEDNPPAVCLEQQIIRSGPGEQYIELNRAEAGTKLRLLGPSAAGSGGDADIWRQVRYSKEGIGWIRTSSLLLL